MIKSFYIVAFCYQCCNNEKLSEKARLGGKLFFVYGKRKVFVLARFSDTCLLPLKSPTEVTQVTDQA